MGTRRSKRSLQPVLKLSVGEELAEWFLNQKREIIEPGKIASAIKSMKQKRPLPVNRKDYEVTREELNRHITEARKYLETPARRCTIVYSHASRGYMCGEGKDLALYTAKWIKRTLHCADRTTRLTNIADRRDMPEALRKVFVEQKGKVKALSADGKKFIGRMVEFMKEDRKRITEEKK